MSLRLLAAAASAALALGAGAASSGSGAVPEEACKARPLVEQFTAALEAGDLTRLDQLFAREEEGWAWYSVSDPAGQRLHPEARERSSLREYLESRIRVHEQLRLLSIDENGHGNFGIRLERRADDLQDGRPVVRLGKGKAFCSKEKIGVFTLGGAPAPKTFGPCPRGALPLTRRDLRAAGAAVLRFVDRTYSQMLPGLDVRGARVTSSSLAAGTAPGYAARVRCGRSIQRRTTVVIVRFPRVAPRQPNATAGFYVSRLRSGMLVWRLSD